MNEITDLRNIVSYYARMLLNATCADEKAFVEPKYRAAKSALVKAELESNASYLAKVA